MKDFLVSSKPGKNVFLPLTEVLRRCYLSYLERRMLSDKLDCFRQKKIMSILRHDQQHHFKLYLLFEEKILGLLVSAGDSKYFVHEDRNPVLS